MGCETGDSKEKYVFKSVEITSFCDAQNNKVKRSKKYKILL